MNIKMIWPKETSEYEYEFLLKLRNLIDDEFIKELRKNKQGGSLHIVTVQDEILNSFISIANEMTK